MEFRSERPEDLDADRREADGVVADAIVVRAEGPVDDLGPAARMVDREWLAVPLRARADDRGVALGRGVDDDRVGDGDRNGHRHAHLDGFSRLLGFDNMDDRPVTGTTEWTQYAIVLDVPDDAIMFFFGVFQVGPGASWFDDLTLEVVDESVPTTP